MKKCLFIGGPINGEIIYSISGDKIELPVVGEAGFGPFVYERSNISYGDFYLFVPGGWSEEKAMEFLFDMYSNLNGLVDSFIEKYETD